MHSAADYEGLTSGSDELVNRLVQEHMGWATSIAKAVARSWNMDWQLDGLDGGAFEALLFCSRRYDPVRGVPFRAYARRRIHEAATQEARKSKSWQQGVGANDQIEQDAREISARLFDVFPELRDGILPDGGSSSGGGHEGGEDSMRSSVRQLLAGASLLAAFQQSAKENPELAVEYKELLKLIALLDPVHQEIVWAVYWQGQSMRSLAEDWGLDDLSIIREHKEILEHLSGQIASSRSTRAKPLKVRRGLRAKALQMKRAQDQGPFRQFIENALRMLFLIIVNGASLW